MNELMHRQAEKSRQEQQKWQSARAEAEALTPEQVRSLEAQLRKTPEDGAVREKLMLRYYLDKDVRSNNRHILWAIAHQPLGELARPIEPLHDKASYDEGKKLWLEHISEPGVSADMLLKAANYLKAGDKPLRRKILLRGQQEYPNRRWSFELANLYYEEVIVGSQGTLPLGVVRVTSVADARGADATEVRQKLEQDTDPVLLAQVGRHLCREAWNMHPGDLDFDPARLGRTYLERAVALDPNQRGARQTLDMAERERSSER